MRDVGELELIDETLTMQGQSSTPYPDGASKIGWSFMLFTNMNFSSSVIALSRAKAPEL